MTIFNLHQPFFVPIWRRVALVAFCLGWALVEFFTAAPFWGVLFGSMGIYACWQFFLTEWAPADDKTGDSKV